jgi:hypothetical protein
MDLFWGGFEELLVPAHAPSYRSFLDTWHFHFLQRPKERSGTERLYDTTGNGIFLCSDEVRNSIDKRDFPAARGEA